MTGFLAGKVAIITGAAGGQGEAEARLFVSQGAKVVLTDISERGEYIAKELGAQCAFVQHDVSSTEAWTMVLQKTLGLFGRVDVLVNNAGIGINKPLQDTEPMLMEQHYKINQLGVYLGMRAVIPAMSRAGAGSIINISSGAALGGTPGMFAYASSKWAVRGMSKAAAADLAPLRIRVNTVLPGLIDTPMLYQNGEEQVKAYLPHIPLGRLGTPGDVAGLVCFLASDAASYITGTEVGITGGIVM